MDCFPDEADQAVSLPQKLSVTTMACWKDAKQDAIMDEWIYNAYKEAEQVGRGQYVADFDVRHRLTKVSILKNTFCFCICADKFKDHDRYSTNKVAWNTRKVGSCRNVHWL